MLIQIIFNIFKVYAAYRTMMREYVALLGGNSSSTQVEDMLELDMELANVSAETLLRLLDFGISLDLIYSLTKYLFP